ncbi:FdtA/QdtA family cupin domain-containing protein [Prevotella sp. S7 MS 2]|uniref:sugar 3,4-ketoisomerase n=2 Tax=unclassified Prevotella TaxID=2638335 RepID=UPI000512DE31|nr:FdtA/QdtA family cupin domain-containing protein [Prevotella sp. S7 MS 2]KGI59949.1 WxcM domain-containing protein [Prevotella sp. S7 MS 2]
MNIMELGKLIHLQKIRDLRGNLTVAQKGENLPFVPQRVYWVYDIPSGGCRGGHAHKLCLELIVAVSGSFEVVLDNGKEQKTYFLNNPNQGLLVDTGVWRTLEKFSSGAVCLVLASEPFEESDYIREYNEYINYMECLK